MEHIIDTFIYILITIVAFVISTLGKKKKKPYSAPLLKNNREQKQT